MIVAAIAVGTNTFDCARLLYETVGACCHDVDVDWRKRGADPAELAALHPGVPAWLERQLLGWATVCSTEEHFNEWNNKERRPAVTVLAGYETAVRRPVSLVDGFRSGGVPYLFGKMSTEEFLDFIDYLVFVASERPNADQVLGYLEDMLSKAGSEWAVGRREGFASLVHRVPEGVQVAADAAIQGGGTAGQLLAEAWHALFGRAPDYEEAYEKAIKAVEEAGAHLLLPHNPKATLGTMAQTLEDQTAWKLALGDDPKHPSQDVVAKMARALWSGQESRHGGNGYRKPTLEEAESAVLLAVPLVQWFSSGAVAKR